MKTWTAETWVGGTPEHVLELLTRPHGIARWAPIPFELHLLETNQDQTRRCT
jgi:hypothetical protein